MRCGSANGSATILVVELNREQVNLEEVRREKVIANSPSAKGIALWLLVSRASGRSTDWPLRGEERQQPRSVPSVAPGAVAH